MLLESPKLKKVVFTPLSRDVPECVAVKLSNRVRALSTEEYAEESTEQSLYKLPQFICSGKPAQTPYLTHVYP
ncbi:hypothetical protein Hypma_004357 [Hypsizygus marmoreus]|uniref:Uncharacterized protein n=1 Tax=Hypsizygus marmoreus TaxID=39966 RepID=A0A369K8M5_HYPMA|nr:hypothetical protein Hypma_004357 [Hypsizygus marmoreus]